MKVKGGPPPRTGLISYLGYAANVGRSSWSLCIIYSLKICIHLMLFKYTSISNHVNTWLLSLFFSLENALAFKKKKIIDMDSKVSIISGSNTNEKLEHLCFFVCLFLLIWATIDRGWKGEAECTLEGLCLSSLSTSHKQKWQEHFCAYSGGVSWTTSRHSWQHTQSLGSAFVVWNGKYSGRECYLLKSQID